MGDRKRQVTLEFIYGNPTTIIGYFLKQNNDEVAIPIKDLEDLVFSKKEIKVWEDIKSNTLKIKLVDKKDGL